VLVAFVHQANGLTHDFAGVVVEPALDLFPHDGFKAWGETNVDGNLRCQALSNIDIVIAGHRLRTTRHAPRFTWSVPVGLFLRVSQGGHEVLPYQ
jgi:hypothetical protein